MLLQFLYFIPFSSPFMSTPRKKQSNGDIRHPTHAWQPLLLRDQSAT